MAQESVASIVVNLPVAFSALLLPFRVFPIHSFISAPRLWNCCQRRALSLMFFNLGTCDRGTPSTGCLPFLSSFAHISQCFPSVISPVIWTTIPPLQPPSTLHWVGYECRVALMAACEGSKRGTLWTAIPQTQVPREKGKGECAREGRGTSLYVHSFLKEDRAGGISVHVVV
ncbi:hypothetical protein BJV74DRAFT_860033 [Russula compacta]|nr:hypothetical protein BJV74DRAFT_860033 [Russula compacta]